ncbi:MAG: GTPase HflX [Deltaproteobacteria bacterium]|nr:GTPase HflX [Deltaproteobacteria bacterium]
MAAEVHGNVTGLKASALRAAERLYRRRLDPAQVVSPELASALCALSVETGRQLGVLFDRKGHPDHVIVGDANKLWMPDIGRLRAGLGRLRGLRLVHTHLRGEGLSNDDLTDLALLRFDLVSAITMYRDGRPALVHSAHLLPENPQGKLWRVLPAEPVHAQTLDLAELVPSLEEEFARAARVRAADRGKDRAILVHVASRGAKHRAPEVCVAELKELCRTAGVTVLDVVVQQRDRPDPRYVVGRGKLEEIVQRANQLGAELLVLDPNLSPAQARAVSEATELKVIDRTMLILDIFAQRARSRDGKVQVELAQLKYLQPRLVEKNTMMSRLTGGIGGRGPGETKLEINRRRVRERITRLERQIEELSRQRGGRRALRQQRDLPIVSIVGYTNAGKSTLLNTLTQAETLAEDKLFATLDPTSRRLRFPEERELLLTDTVGFIHELPAELVNAFRATLEELSEADLLLHVVDISDDEYRQHIEAVEKILSDLGVSDTPTVVVFNKMDRLDPEVLAERRRCSSAIPVCALRAETTRPLLAAVEEQLWRQDRLDSPRSEAELGDLV